MAEYLARVRVTRFQIVIACLLLLAVVAVFVAPSVDLDPTTLGSQQAASITIMVVAGTILASVLVLQWGSLQDTLFHTTAFPFLSLLDLICSRLC